MGQTTSKNQGTLTFGHIASNTTLTATNTSSADTTHNNSNDENDNDLVLNQPHLYALADLHLSPQLTLPSPPASPTAPVSSVRLGRVDSGYDERIPSNNTTQQSQLSLLKKELIYIDTTYYHPNNTQTRSSSSSSSSSLNNYTSNKNNSDNDEYQTNMDSSIRKTMTTTTTTSTNIINVRFTFLDAYNGSVDKSMQEINLSGRKLINLSCNIARLNMIRKLDL